MKEEFAGSVRLENADSAPRRLGIRPALAGDLPMLARLEAQCFSLPHTEEQLAYELNSPVHRLFCAERNGEIMGYAGMSAVLDEGYVGNIAVFPEYRRQGAADALMQALLDECAAQQLSFLSLEVRSQNAPAIALYRKHGFITAAVQKGAYTQPKDDALIMTRYFTA